ncbi:hypothetical protein C0992_009923 [Termitomyces sp. T32_za158]|nr:hypothetical protein C0992_009923 [Termitomyces sp. T32_za158]
MATHKRNNSDTFRALSRHENYYLSGGDLFFLAEAIHFRVHRYFFERESLFFQRQLQVPASPGAVARGSTEGTAIILEEHPDDFAKFLWVFYNPRYSLYDTSVDNWKVILRLAHKWDFLEIKNLVVRELEKLEMADVDRIATYQNHAVDKNYLIPRYAALCEREQPLTLEEGTQLGMATTLMIARAREYARSNPAADGSRSPTTAGIREDEMHGLVRLLFEIQPPAQANDQANTTASGTGSGTSAGGSATRPPRPPQKEPTVPPTPTDKPLKPSTGPTAPPPDKPEDPKKRKKTNQLEPLVTTKTTSPDPKLPPVSSPKEAKTQESQKTAPEKPLVDIGEPASLGTTQEPKDANGMTKDGINGSDKPNQNGTTSN